jgi:hypothetical protein
MYEINDYVVCLAPIGALKKDCIYKIKNILYVKNIKHIQLYDETSLYDTGRFVPLKVLREQKLKKLSDKK